MSEEEEDLVFPVRFIAADKRISHDMARGIEGSHTVKGKTIRVHAHAISLNIGQLGHMEKMVSQYYTMICLYIAKQEEISVLIPMLETFTDYPIKILLVENGVTIPPDTLPLIPRVNSSDFESLLNTLYDEKEKLNAQLMKVFKAMDKDKSGFLDAEELIIAAKELNKDLTKQEADEIVAKIDTNGDGKISFHEFSFWWGSGQTLFGVGLKDALHGKLTNSEYAKMATSAIQEVGKVQEFEKVNGFTSLGINKDKPMKLEVTLKAATYGTEYINAKSNYFPQYKPGGLQLAIVLNCRNVETALPIFQSIVDSFIFIGKMMMPQNLVAAAEWKPIISSTKSSIILNFPLTSENVEARRKTIEMIGLLIPISKISNQYVELKLKLASDLDMLTKEMRPIYWHLLNGFAIELRTQVLKKNVELLSLLLTNSMQKKGISIESRIFLQTILFGLFDVKLKMDKNLQELIVNQITGKKQELDIPFRDLKEMVKILIKTELEFAPPYAKMIYGLFHDQVEGFEIVTMTDELFVAFLASLPGLNEFLNLD